VYNPRRDLYLSLDIVDINNPSDLNTNINEAELVCSFRRPVPAAGAEREFFIRSEYPPSWAPDSTPKYIFSTSRNDRILAIESNPSGEQRCVLFVHLSTILARTRSICGGQTGCIFPWEHWGLDDFKSPAISMIQKFIKPSRDRSDFQLYDLNRRSISHLLLFREVDSLTKLKRPLATLSLVSLNPFVLPLTPQMCSM